MAVSVGRRILLDTNVFILERSVRVLRALRSRGRDAFLSDEAAQDRAERHAQL